MVPKKEHTVMTLHDGNSINLITNDLPLYSWISEGLNPHQSRFFLQEVVIGTDPQMVNGKRIRRL